MPHTIEQPSGFSDEAQRTLARLNRTDGPTPATGITRLDVPFEDVFWFVFKVVASLVLVAVLMGAVVGALFLAYTVIVNS